MYKGLEWEPVFVNSDPVQDSISKVSRILRGFQKNNENVPVPNIYTYIYINPLRFGGGFAVHDIMFFI